LNKKFNIQTILVAPLDWGLGHATRCMPIIQTLIDNGYTVMIAASGKQQILLKQAFPTLTFIELKGYQIQYAKSKSLLPLKIILQIPKILFTIYHENRWLRKTILQYNIDAVISDNRYGLYHTKIPSVFITHQLLIKMPFSWLEKLVQQINYKFIEKYTACWVPDFQDANNIAGDLSNPQNLPKTPIHYLGLLSRFQLQKDISIQYDFCIILSGPEPQRTILENKIFNEIKHTENAILLVRGKPDSKEILTINNKVTIKNHLPSKELNIAMQQSNFIVCRSGYTTVMELLSLQKKAILIATPGQTEQEYLANKLMQQQWCYAIEQQNFSWQNIVIASKEFQFIQPQFPTKELSSLIASLMQQLDK
jgi:uncharacterized protein (TIGR00661 family)